MRLKRITNKIFGKTASPAGDESVGAYIGQFGSAKIGTYNGTGDVEEIQALSAWDNGWIDAVIPNQQYPCLPEMTGFGKVLSYQTGYIMQEGICEWDSGTEYCKNSIVKYVPETITYSASADIGASTGITGASVDVDTFTTQITTDGDYAFIFDGSVWQYEGVTTNLTLYGITYTGTPATDDVITITLTSTIYRGDGTLYISLTDENINNNPSTDSVNWLLYSSGANKDLSNLSPTGQAVIDGKVNDTGDTITGPLVFSGTGVNGAVTNKPVIQGEFRYDITSSTLPPSSTYYYAGARQIKNYNTQNTVAGDYYRYDAEGKISHIFYFNNHNNGVDYSNSFNIAVDKSGNIDFSTKDTSMYFVKEYYPLNTSNPGYRGYMIFSNEQVIQWDFTNDVSTVDVLLPVPMYNQYYNLIVIPQEQSTLQYPPVITNKTSTGFTISANGGTPAGRTARFSWRVCGRKASS